MSIQQAEDFIYSLQGDNDETIITDINLTTGFVNATKMCKSAGKFWNNYYENKRTKEFLKELSSNTGIPVLDLVISKRGGGTTNTGTWVHPDVAIDVASWCSTKFQVAVAKLVRRYMSGELTTEESKAVAAIANDANVLVTSFHLKRVVYFGKIDTDEFKGIKVGFTDDLKQRESTHKREIGNFKFVKIFETLNNTVVERKILDECKAKGVRRSCIINGKMQTELIELGLNFSLENLIDLAKEIINTNAHPIIEEKERIIRNLEADKSIEYEKQKTRQLELEIELAKLNNIIKEPEIQEDETHPITEFINKYCEIGQDIPTNRYRVTIKDLYKAYTECHNNIASIYPPICEKEFNNYLTDVLKMTYRYCNWSYHTYMTWFNIRIKEKPLTLIQRLITDFIDIECVLEKTYCEDTKLIYDAFEKYALDKGFEAMKKNGFSRQNFRTQLIANHSDISVKKWAINGKKHGFSGIKLRTSISLDDVVKIFVEEKCVKGFGFRAKNIDLIASFNEFIKDRYVLNFKKITFYNTLHKQNPELTEKHVTQSNMGFVGIALKNTVED
jgi:hypothetical protein